jgi:hypothetical protein
METAVQAWSRQALWSWAAGALATVSAATAAAANQTDFIKGVPPEAARAFRA